MNQEYDLVIIGGGTGGYVAAIRASQLGLKTAIVEKDKLGGTCLHKGCIPSKALLRSAEVYALTKKSDRFGVVTGDVHLNFMKVQQRKEEIIDQLYKGVQYLINKGKIDIYHGIGRILGPSIFSPVAGTVSVEMDNGEENKILIPKNVLIATGSSPKMLPDIDRNHQDVMTSDEALEMEQLPTSIIIIGGGAIGLEWASMLADFGVEVTVLENADRILPMEDEDVSIELQRLLNAKGIEIITDATVLPNTLTSENGKNTIKVEKKGEIVDLTSEKILVSIGRQANIDQIGLQNTEIVIEQNCIQVNEYFQTKESHIYAIGDVIGGLQLAHVAAHEGIKAVEHIAGIDSEPMQHENIPRCVYSNPEVASIGLTEREARKNYEVKVGKFPFKAIGKALVFGDANGFVKIVADKKTNDTLGIHMVGPNVTELISEASLARLMDATPWEIGQAIHPHPSLSEAVGEAALAVDGLSIHL